MKNSFRVLAIVICSAVCLAAAPADDKKPSKSSAAASAQAGSLVDINSASEKELDALPGVGPATAKKIIAGRPYSSVADLSKAGVNSATINKITPLVTAGTAPAKAAAAPAPPPPASAAPAPTAPRASNPSPVTSQTPADARVRPPSTASTTPPADSTGMVWVNKDSKIYHKPGDRYYGKTKNGEYMRESDAIAQGYRASKQK
jgi:hypothetical protein